MAKKKKNGSEYAFVKNEPGSPSNLPQDKKMGMFPECPYGGNGYTYGDDLGSADEQMRVDIKFFNRKKKKNK